MPGSDGSLAARPDQDRTAGSLRLDASLWRLVEEERQFDRQLARGLGRLWREELYRRLGFVRAIDFVRERLGIRESRARWLARLGQHLVAIPEIDAALAGGRINASQVIELARVVGSTTPSAERQAWIERAAGKPVRALRKEVVNELRRRERASAEPEASRPEPDEGDNGALPRSGAGGRELDLDADPEVPPPGGWMSIPVPARVAVLWHGAMDLARAAGGQHCSEGQCAEMIFAEYLSACPPEGETEDKGPEHPGSEGDGLLRMVLEALHSGRARLIKPGESAPAAGDRPAADHHPDAPEPRACEAAAPLFPASSPPPEVLLPGCMVDDGEDAWQLAAILEHLSDLKKRLRYDMGGILKRMRDEATWQAVGFASFEEYCEKRLGFGLRRAERLIRFRLGLDRFQRLRQAYLESGISYTAALLLLPILHYSTEEAWVVWADGVTYRELERVAEFARIFALPDAHPAVFESWVQGLVRQGFAGRRDGGESDRGKPAPEEATAFAAVDDPAARPRLHPVLADIPLGYALPPSAPGALPAISGMPDDLSFTDPELCVARVRFWLPPDALEVAHLALHRCRHRLPDPLGPTWAYLEVILVHFIQSIDTPAAREFNRRHKIIARDGYWCRVPGCTSRAYLHGHHLIYQSHGGPTVPWNLATACAGHHGPGIHRGVLKIGGWAPHQLTTKLGIDPRSGRALACYQGERRVSAEVAEAALAHWRSWWLARERTVALFPRADERHPPGRRVAMG